MVRTAFVAAMLGLLALSSAASADCKIETFGDLSLKTSPGRAYVGSEINGHPAQFIVDTGAQISGISYADARRLGTKMLFADMTSEGIGGSTVAGTAMFELKLGTYSFPRHEMMVSGRMLTDGGAAVGLIGRDMLLQHDLELNLKDSSLRLLKVRGCAPEQLVYWASGKPYGEVQLIQGDTLNSPIVMMVYLNGKAVRAELDSGSPHSAVTVAAARRAGVGADATRPLGEISGVGPHRVAAGVATFKTFSIDDETIHNAEIIVADVFKYNKIETTGSHLGAPTNSAFALSASDDTPQMLLGADFLRAHRVLISPDRGVMVFTYQGGPIFADPGRISPLATPPGDRASTGGDAHPPPG